MLSVKFDQPCSGSDDPPADDSMFELNATKHEETSNDPASVIDWDTENFATEAAAVVRETGAPSISVSIPQVSRV